MKRALALCLCLMAPWPSLGQTPEVVTDIPVVHSLTSAVMGELGQPRLLVDQGADPHHMQLRPSQVSALNGADLILWVGPELEPWLERALADREGRSVALLHQPGVTLREYADPKDDSATVDDHSDHDHDHHAEAADHQEPHGHEGIDPHAWLDPDNAALWVGVIADAMAQVDPANAVTYRANATLTQARLRALDESLRRMLAPAQGIPLAFAHDAYGYFADHYGLQVVATLAEGDASTPGAGHLSQLRAMIEAGEIACFLPEAGRDDQAIHLLADGTGTRIGEPVDPAGRMIEPGPTLYETMMRSLAQAVADCASGS